MFFDGLQKQCLLVMSRENGYAEMDQFRSANIAESPTCENDNACQTALVLANVGDSTLHNFSTAYSNHFTTRWGRIIYTLEKMTRWRCGRASANFANGVT